MTQQFSAHDTSEERRLSSVSAIAEELAQVMQELNQSDADTEAPPPARASVMNLVLVGPDRDTIERAAEVAAQLSYTYPSRTFAVTASPADLVASLDGYVSSYCYLSTPESKEVVCLEQVRLQATGETARHLDGIILPLLLPDLPVFLWWIGEPPEETDALLQSCNRLIVDSTGFREPLPQLARLYRILPKQAAGPVGEHRRDGAALSDFTWLRLAPWRELLAQFFDGQETLPYLDQMSNVRVEYATDPGGAAHASPSLLLLGWLAAKLRWQYHEVTTRAGERDYRLSFTKLSGAQVTAQVVPRARRGEPGYTGELLTVELTALTEGLEATFSVSLAHDGVHATTRAHLPGLRDIIRTVPLERASMVDLLLDELGSVGSNAAFEESLAVTARMLR